MFYNLSEFMTKLKQDIAIRDIPIPVSDEDLVARFYQSALKEFSVRSPHIRRFGLPPEAIVNDSHSLDGSVTYRIPQSVYQDTPLLTVLSIDVGRSSGFSDYYAPTTCFGSPEMILESIADIKLAAGLGAMMQHSPTFNFTYPDLLQIWSGWTGGTYMCEGGFMHDISLSTIPPGSFTHLFQLAKLDICEYLYNILKRKNNLELGVGSVNLMLDTWESAADRKADLLKEWDESSSLDLDVIYRF